MQRWRIVLMLNRVIKAMRTDIQNDDANMTQATPVLDEAEKYQPELARQTEALKRSACRRPLLFPQYAKRGALHAFLPPRSSMMPGAAHFSPIAFNDSSSAVDNLLKSQ